MQDADTDMFFIFDRPVPFAALAAPLTTSPPRSTRHQRDRHGPLSTGRDDAVIADRDNARAGGRR